MNYRQEETNSLQGVRWEDSKSDRQGKFLNMWNYFTFSHCNPWIHNIYLSIKMHNNKTSTLISQCVLKGPILVYIFYIWTLISWFQWPFYQGSRNHFFISLASNYESSNAHVGARNTKRTKEAHLCPLEAFLIADPNHKLLVIAQWSMYL